MKLSDKTLEVLSNFSSINPSLVIKEGSSISTIANGGSILACAEVDDKFGTEIAIYDLPSFLSFINLIDDPVLNTENDNYVLISGDKTSYKFFMADTSVINTPPKDSIDLPSEDVKIKLPESDIKKVLKAASVFGMDNVCLYSEDQRLYFGARDPDVQNSDSFSVEVLSDYDGPEIQLYIAKQKLVLLPGDYEVVACFDGRRKILQFDNQNDFKVKYWIPVEKISTVTEKT